MNKLEKIFKRLENLNSSVGPPANCAGTALYLVGLIDKDDCREDLDRIHEGYLKKLTELENPELGCLISWEKKRKRIEVIHLGIISDLDPLRLIHRPGTWHMRENALVVEDYLKNVKKNYDKGSNFLKYYLVD